MDRYATEDKVLRRIRILVILSSTLSSFISLVYLVTALVPIWYFNGYVKGYYSFLNYRLYYSYNEQPIPMPHTDYIRYISLTFALLSLCLLLLSLFSASQVKRRTQTALGLAYGVATALGVLYGLLNGYLYRAAGLDISRFNYLNSRLDNKIVLRTSAGTIVFDGVRIDRTFIHLLVFESPALIVIIVLAVASSAVATSYTLWRLYQNTAKIQKQRKGVKIKLGLTNIALFILALRVIASVFTYHPASITVSPQPPSATLEPPPYAYTCVNLVRTSRGALTYTDFEVYPVPGWVGYGGGWGLSPGGGFRGNALRGQDNNSGVGLVSSQYYWNTRIDNYSSLWVSLRTRAETADGYKGIGLINTDRNRLYEISVNNGYAYIRKWDGAWRSIGSTSIPGYTATSWYILVLSYNDTGLSIGFELWVYDYRGNLVAFLTANDAGATRFRPAYAGVTIDAIRVRWFMFDDFIVSTADPRSILLTGFYTGMRVEVWDNLGNLVNSTTAPTSSFYLNVTLDIVIGTGTNGKVIIWYPDLYDCGVLTTPMTDSIIGGDVYSLSTQPILWSLEVNRTSAKILVNISGSTFFNTTTRFLRISTQQTFYAKLILVNISAPTTLNLDLWVIGVNKSSNITIRDGIPFTDSTDILKLYAGELYYVTLSGYFSNASQLAILNMKLELCTAPSNMGACVYYPIALELRS